MKIFIFVTLDFTRFYGGVERILLNFLQHAEGRSNEIYIFGLVYDSAKLSQDVIEEFRENNLFRFKYENDKPIRFIRSLFGIDYSSSYEVITKALSLTNKKPDVIIAIGSMLPPDIKKALKDLKLNVKVVSWVHINLIPYPEKDLKTRIKNFLLTWIRSRRLKYADAHLAISTGMKEQILKLSNSTKIYTVFNPLQKIQIKNLIKRPERAVFIYVGRIDDYQKNISFMLKGMARVNKDWKLILIGRGCNEKELKSLANSLGISQKVEWKGFKEDPYENLDEGVTALLLTSRFEGLPMALAEANQRGIPFISSNCEVGPSDIVIPGVNGYLYPEGDMDAFVRTVNDVIDGKLTFGTPEEIAKTAERFSGDVVCDNIINALRDITGLK